MSLTVLLPMLFLFLNTDINYISLNKDDKKLALIQDEPIFTATEIMPTFKGGSVELYKYLTSNIKYPIVGKNENKEKRVYIKFVVEKDGSITKVEVLKGVSEDLEQEAKRAVENMPKWNPAKQSFRYVRCYYHLTIDFK